MQDVQSQLTLEDLTRALINKFGKIAQINKCIEECGELIRELIAFKPDTAKINEEMADVYITASQMKILFKIEANTKERTYSRYEFVDALINLQKWLHHYAYTNSTEYILESIMDVLNGIESFKTNWDIDEYNNYVKLKIKRTWGVVSSGD